MDLENIILGEVTQTRKTIVICTNSSVAFRHKAKKTNLQFTIPENLDNNEDPKRHIHTSNLHGK